MSEPSTKLRSKLNRAIAAHLVSEGAGTAGDVLPHKSSVSKTFPNTTVRATVGRPEVIGQGIYRITVHTTIKGSAVVIDGNDPEAEFDERVGKTADALMLSYEGDGQTLRATAEIITERGRALATDPNNADMADFTVLGWFDAGFGDGDAEAEGCDWVEVLIHEAVCCASNVD